MAKNSAPRKPTWSEIYHDGYEVLMSRQISLYRYHFISSFNWEDMTGEENTAGRYHFELVEVDLPFIRLDTVRSAIESCGDGEGDLFDRKEDQDAYHEYIAECCRSYGAYAPLEQFDGNNWNQLLAQAKKLSSHLLDDCGDHQNRMDRAVNRMGTSAWDFMTGNMWNSRNIENLRTLPAMAQEYITLLEKRLEEKDKQIEELTDRLQKRVA